MSRGSVGAYHSPSSRICVRLVRLEHLPVGRRGRLVDRRGRLLWSSGTCLVLPFGRARLVPGLEIWYHRRAQSPESWLKSEYCRPRKRTIHLLLPEPRTGSTCRHRTLAGLRTLSASNPLGYEFGVLDPCSSYYIAASLLVHPYLCPRWSSPPSAPACLPSSMVRTERHPRAHPSWWVGPMHLQKAEP